MAPSSRRRSLDLFQMAVPGGRRSESFAGISKFMDLRIPTNKDTDDVKKVECECCGLTEECTGAYVRCVRDTFCGRWVCGLCAEAIKGELDRLGLPRHIVMEEAVVAHMEVCKKFNKKLRTNPAMSLVAAMAGILKRGCRRSDVS